MSDLERALASMGLRLGMTIPNWPPGIVECLAAGELRDVPHAIIRSLWWASRQEVRARAGELEESLSRARLNALPAELRPRLVLRTSELWLSPRVRRVLATTSHEYLGDLARCRVKELLGVPGIGRTSLEEIERELGRAGLGLEMDLPSWNREIALAWEAELAAELRELRYDRTRVMLRVAGKLPETLEQELGRLVRQLSKPRDSRIIIRSLGWDGRGRRTPSALALESGSSPEDVRQIEKTFRAHMRGRHLGLDMLDRAQAYAMARCPGEFEEIARGLATAGITSAPFSIDGLMTAVEILRPPLPFRRVRIDGRHWLRGRLDRD
jgi:hypothetical protein